MSLNEAPRDAYAATDVWVPVDATGDDFYDLGSRFGTQVGVFSELHEETGHPYVLNKGAGFFDPRCLRWHQLQRLAAGALDNRLSVQVLNDYEAEYEDARPGDAPFGQAEFFTALNRTTREADSSGRVALTSSHRRVIDSEDDRYALALTCRSVPLHAASMPVPEEDEPGSVVPPDVQFKGAGTEDEGSYGGVTRTRPSVSVGGVTFFGRGAVSAAQEALAKGGTSADMARWASAAARGLPMPPLLGKTAERSKRDPGPTSVRKDLDPGWSVPLLNHPAGYVWSKADVIGLLGTLVVPEGAAGEYFKGREGTPIGPLPWRHDAQVSMGKDLVGRIVFVSNDAAELPEGKGKLVKGELWADSSRANQDTELGLETVQWRPVVPVDADLPPSRPPPWDPPWVDPPEEEDPEEEEKDAKKKKPPPKGGPGGGGRRRPDDDEDEDTLVGETTFDVPRREVEPGGEDGELPPVTDPGAQARDYSGPGEPCPNSTAGTLRLQNTDDDGTRLDPTGFPGVRRVPGGGYVQFSGHPALTLTPQGLVVGGFEGLSLGLPLGRRRGRPRGVDVGPPSDKPGRVPLGLPKKKRRRPGGFDVDPPLGDDKGIPRGAEERWQRRQRKERARRAREARDKRERKRLDELEDMEARARRKGKVRLADRIKRARNKIEKRRKKREEKAKRRKEYQDRLKKEREERRKKREERRKKRREERARRRRQRRKRLRKKRRKTVPQGGYLIDTTTPESAEASRRKLTPEERKRLEQDERREKERRRRQGEIWEEEARFGDWNVANARLPFLGSVGGPSSLEGWSHLVTYQVRAMQRVVTGAFGGPSYLASNLGVMHRNRPGNPPVGSRVGAWWTAVPGQKLEVRDAPVEVVSVLEAQPGGTVCAREVGVLEVVREHRGEGVIEDSRPLVLLKNGGVKSNLIADSERRFLVSGEGGVRAACVGVYGQAGAGGKGPLFEVGLVDRAGRVVERFFSVERDGSMCVFGELKVAGSGYEPLLDEPSAAGVDFDELP